MTVAAHSDPFLAMAVAAHRARIVEELGAYAYARSAYLEVELNGVPGVAKAYLYAWPEPLGRPTRIGIDVIRLDDKVLSRPVAASFTLRDDECKGALGRGSFSGGSFSGGSESGRSVTVSADDLELDIDDPRPQVIRFGEAEWRLCPFGGVVSEAVDLDESGQLVTQDVDTSMYCYKLICPKCGRARYAKRNSIHQIKYCRVCTRQERLRQRALKQYRARADARARGDGAGAPGVCVRTPPTLVEEILRLWDEGERNMSAIGRQIGRSLSTVNRVLRKHERKR